MVKITMILMMISAVNCDSISAIIDHSPSATTLSFFSSLDCVIDTLEEMIEHEEDTREESHDNIRSQFIHHSILCRLDYEIFDHCENPLKKGIWGEKYPRRIFGIWSPVKVSENPSEKKIGTDLLAIWNR